MKCFLQPQRLLNIDKLGTGGGQSRLYLFGYGILDANLNGQADPGETKVFEQLGAVPGLAG